MRKGIPIGKNKTNQNSAPGKDFVWARWFVIALGIFIIVAASAHGQTPVFIQDSVSSEEAGPSRIIAMMCWKEGATERGGWIGWMAEMGYVVSLAVGNLG